MVLVKQVVLRSLRAGDGEDGDVGMVTIKGVRCSLGGGVCN